MIKSRNLCVILLFCLVLRALGTMCLQVTFTNNLEQSLYYHLTLLSQAAMYVLLVFLCIYQFKISAHGLGVMLGKRPNWAQLGFAVFWGLTLFTFTAGENALETWAISQFDTDLAYRLWPFRTTTNTSYGNPIDYGLILFLSVLLAPAAEEFFFRGLLFQALTRRMGLHAAAVASSALFILVHYPHPHALSTLVFSMSLCYIYRATGSVFLCAVVHSTFNASVFFVEAHWRSVFTRSAEQIHSFSVWLPQFALLAISSAIICMVVFRCKGSITQG